MDMSFEMSMGMIDMSMSMSLELTIDNGPEEEDTPQMDSEDLYENTEFGVPNRGKSTKVRSKGEKSSKSNDSTRKSTKTNKTDLSKRRQR